MALVGILPWRGSLMIDVVFLATFAIMLILAVSVYLVRYRYAFRLHARIQVGLAILLIVAITAFEIDLRFFTEWRRLASVSAYYSSGWVDRWLAIHLCFAIPTPLLWAATIWLGLRWFGWDPKPNRHSLKHRWIGRIAGSAMGMTMVTGWVFYYVAFVA